MNLWGVLTAELVDELSKREDVEKIIAEPYQDYKIIVGDSENHG